MDFWKKELTQMYAYEFDEKMPSWYPPSPPISDNEFDLKMEDESFDLIYEIDPMNEARLPSQILELRRPLAEKQRQQTVADILTPKEHASVLDAVQKCLQMPIQNITAASPAYTENSFSMEDNIQDMKPDVSELRSSQSQSELSVRPIKKRRENPRNKAIDIGVKKSTTPPPPIHEECDYDGAEWSIIEDHALLQAVQTEMTSQTELEKTRRNDGCLFNWEFVAMIVNKATRFYRSARQCCIRYQMFVRPKELGHLMVSDPITKKPVKVELSTLELSHLRKGRSTTTSQYNYDYGMLTDKKHFNRFKMIKSITTRKTATFWRGPKEARNLDCMAGRVPPRHEAKLAEFEVRYGPTVDAEEISFVPEEKMITNDSKRKSVEKLNPVRQESPVPRANTLLLRPHVVPVKPGSPLPSKPQMTIIVPPLITPVLPVVAPPPQPTRVVHTAPTQPTMNIDHSHQHSHQMPSGSQQQMISSTGHVIQSHSQMQQPVQRRTTSMANVQTHYVQQNPVGSQGSSQVSNFVVVNSNQQQNMGNSNQDGTHVQMMQNVGGVQGQRITQYITQPGQQAGVRGRGISSLPMYTSSPQMVVQTASRTGPQRVMRGGVPGRMFVQQPGGERQSYVMQQQPTQVRVLPTNQRVNATMVGTMGQRRMGPQPGTVGSLVMPRGGSVGQMRNVPRAYQSTNPINVVVARNQMRPTGTTMGSTHVVSGTAVRRPITATRQLPSIGSRVDSPQTVAQVVLAPPSSNVASSSGSTMPSQAPPILHVQPRNVHPVSSMASQMASQIPTSAPPTSMAMPSNDSMSSAAPQQHINNNPNQHHPLNTHHNPHQQQPPQHQHQQQQHPQ